MGTPPNRQHEALTRLSRRVCCCHHQLGVQNFGEVGVGVVGTNPPAHATTAPPLPPVAVNDGRRAFRGQGEKKSGGGGKGRGAI